MAHQLAIVTGTAGAGKSTTLMRLALAIQAEGKEVAWLTTDVDLSLRQMRDAVRLARAQYLMIDDADTFGASTGAMLCDLASDNKGMKIVAGLRSTRFERLQVEDGLSTINHVVHSIPHLGDSDIQLLLDALTKANRLGELRGLSRGQQVAAFERQAG